MSKHCPKCDGTNFTFDKVYGDGYWEEFERVYRCDDCNEMIGETSSYTEFVYKDDEAYTGKNIIEPTGNIFG